jgi:phosphomannomutase
MVKKLKKNYEINQLDGIKVKINENTWSLIRKSNTEDIIRVSTESNDKQLLKNIQKEIMENVKSCYEETK